MPQYAVLKIRSARLSHMWGYNYAVRLFGQEAIDSLPRLKGGTNKGKPRGYVVWRTAVVAGWCRECQSPLAINQIADAWIVEFDRAPRSAALSGHWLGRMQPLAGAYATFLGPEGRARWAAEREREQARDLAEQREMVRDQLGEAATDAEVDAEMLARSERSRARLAQIAAKIAEEDRRKAEVAAMMSGQIVRVL